MGAVPESWKVVLLLCINSLLLVICPLFNSLSAKKQTTKFTSAKIKKKCIVQYISYWEFKEYRANSVDLDEAAHYEPPHQDLCCLQILLNASLGLKELKHDFTSDFLIYQDHEVLRAWLSDLHYEEYYHNFVQAGYDMPTITHMTPQDLTAIGISKPGHRKKLKAEIGRLNIHDGIPDFKPVSTMQLFIKHQKADDKIYVCKN